MKICEKYEHLNSFDILKKKINEYQQILDIINGCNMRFGKSSPQVIKDDISRRFNNFGWADRVKIKKNSNLTISFMKNKVGICFQIGNVARTYADILKLAVLSKSTAIEVGVMIVPDSKSSKILGANYAQFDRLKREVIIFKDVIDFPLLVFSITN